MKLTLSREIDIIAGLALLLSIVTSITALVKLFVLPNINTIHDDWIVVQKTNWGQYYIPRVFFEFTAVNVNIANNTEILSDIKLDFIFNSCVQKMKWLGTVSIDENSDSKLIYERIQDALPLPMITDIPVSNEVFFSPIATENSTSPGCFSLSNRITWGELVKIGEKLDISVVVRPEYIKIGGSEVQYCDLRAPPGWKSIHQYITFYPDRDWYRFSCDWKAES